MVGRLSFSRLGLVVGEMDLLLVSGAPVSIKGLISINVHCTFGYDWYLRTVYAFTLEVASMSNLLGIHIVFSSLALLAGALALVLRKGGLGHRSSGKVFVGAMLTMGGTSAWLAAVDGVWLDVMSGLLVCYLGVSSWLTMRPRNQRYAVGIMLMGVGLVAGYLLVAWVTLQSGERRPGVPSQAGLFFATIVGLAVISDCRLLMGRALTVRQRLARHLWRMCFALFMATGSVFFSRAHLFPASVQESGVLVLLGVAPILCMVFWLLWIRRGVVQAKILKTTRQSVAR